MENLSDAVLERVHVLMHSEDREPILSTTGTRAAIESLAARTEALEEVVRELVGLVQEVVQAGRSPQ